MPHNRSTAPCTRNPCPWPLRPPATSCASSRRRADRASRQAHATGRLDDETFAAARERFGLDGTLDLLALNGYYSMMAMVLNTAGIPLPDGAEPPLKKL